MSALNGFGIFAAGSIVGGFVGWGLAATAAAARERVIRDREYSQGHMVGWVDGVLEGETRHHARRTAEVLERADHPSTPAPVDPFGEDIA